MLQCFLEPPPPDELERRQSRRETLDEKRSPNERQHSNDDSFCPSPESGSRPRTLHTSQLVGRLSRAASFNSLIEAIGDAAVRISPSNPTIIYEVLHKRFGRAELLDDEDSDCADLGDAFDEDSCTNVTEEGNFSCHNRGSINECGLQRPSGGYSASTIQPSEVEV